MDIRVINKNDEIINVSHLSIMKMDKWLIGMNDRGETVRIEEYKDKEEAGRALRMFGEKIKEANEYNKESIIIVS